MSTQNERSFTNLSDDKDASDVLSFFANLVDQKTNNENSIYSGKISPITDEDNDKLFETFQSCFNKSSISSITISENIHNQIKFIIAALKNDANLLQYLPIPLKENKDICNVAVQQNGLSLQYAFTELKNDIDIVKAAVKQNGLSLQYASTELKDNYDIVLAAIMQNGLSLQYASTRLKDNYDIVLAAIMQNGLSLQYASDIFFKDRYNNMQLYQSAINSITAIITENTEDISIKMRTNLDESKMTIILEFIINIIKKSFDKLRDICTKISPNITTDVDNHIYEFLTVINDRIKKNNILEIEKDFEIIFVTAFINMINFNNIWSTETTTSNDSGQLSPKKRKIESTVTTTSNKSD
jgi:hypothetical protein